MKKYTYIILSSFMVISLCLPTQTKAQDKRAQTTMKFLSAPLGARATGMGDAVTAMNGNSQAIFYNPAAFGFQDTEFDISFGNVSWIADIDYQYAAMTYRPANGQYGVVGLSFMSVDYGELLETTRSNSDLGYDVLGYFYPTATAFGVSYARAISQQFSFGANIRYAELNLTSAWTSRTEREQFKRDTYTVDFGVLFKTGFESLNFAMSLRNYSREVTYIQDTQELPLTFRIGLAMNVFDLTSLNPEQHKLWVSVDANRPRDYYEQLMVGAEYTFMERLHLRSGYVFPTDEQGVSFGVGVTQPFARRYAVKADFSHTSFGIFNSVNRISVQLSF